MIHESYFSWILKCVYAAETRHFIQVQDNMSPFQVKHCETHGPEIKEMMPRVQSQLLHGKHTLIGVWRLDCISRAPDFFLPQTSSCTHLLQLHRNVLVWTELQEPDLWRHRPCLKHSSTTMSLIQLILQPWKESLRCPSDKIQSIDTFINQENFVIEWKMKNWIWRYQSKNQRIKMEHEHWIVNIIVHCQYWIIHDTLLLIHCALR